MHSRLASLKWIRMLVNNTTNQHHAICTASILGGVSGSSCNHRPPSALSTSWGRRRTSPDPSSGFTPGVKRNLSNVSETTTRSSASANFWPMQFLWRQKQACFVQTRQMFYNFAEVGVKQYLGPDEKGIKAWEERPSWLIGSKRPGSNSCQRIHEYSQTQHTHLLVPQPSLLDIWITKVTCVDYRKYEYYTKTHFHMCRLLYGCVLLVRHGLLCQTNHRKKKCGAYRVLTSWPCEANLKSDWMKEQSLQLLHQPAPLIPKFWMALAD